MSTPRTERPVYLGDTHTDRLLAGLMLLAQEIGVLQRRCRDLEAAAGLPVDQNPSDIAVNRLVDALTLAANSSNGSDS